MIEVVKRLLHQSMDDIILCGIVDLKEKPADFVPLMDRVYLIADGSLFELQRDDIRLTVRNAASVHMRNDLEDGHLPCSSSIGKYVFTDPWADNYIVRVVIYGSEGDSCEAIEIVLRSGQTLFFDPSFIDGINFGGIDQKAVWLANSRTHDAVTFE